MKRKLNYFRLVLMFIAVPFLTNSCSDGVNDRDTPSSPSITSLSPNIGAADTEVTIVGEHFGSSSNAVNVTFGDKAATITKLSNTEVKVKAPAGFNNTTVNVAVTVNGEKSNTKPFTYNDMAPTITAISPDNGFPGSVITITGTRFGTDKSNVKVQFNTTDATNIVSVAETQIKVEAPAGFSNQKVNVKVIVSGHVSNTVEFEYKDATPPSISAVTASCFYNSTVVIQGSNFSPIKEENIVKFGAVAATVTAATPTSLTVTTPDLGTATSVNITVSKGGVVSNTRNIAVDVDQNKVATYNWTTHTVKPGVIYKTGEFSLFGTAQRRIFVLDVTLDASNTLGIGFSPTAAATVTMCNSYNAVAGVNAGYFPLGTSSDKDPYIRINGTTVQDGHTNVSPIFTNSALIIHNNVATVRKFTESGRNLNLVAAAIPVAQAQNIIVCGPMLITSGVIENLDMSNSHNSSSTGRTGLGVTADGKRVFMVVVDTGGSVTGISTLQLAKILQALGAVNAMNFDGGGSSTMFVKNQGDNGRVNYPTGGTYQRPVRSVVYVK